ncbi:DNA-processing protein DprA [Salana multivorans]
MDSIAEQARDDRTARIALALFAEADDAATGRLIGRVGAVETVRLLASDGAVPGMSKEAAAMWRKHFQPERQPNALRDVLRTTETLGLSTLIPGDQGFPASLHDVGERLPFVLWVKGAVSLLCGELTDRFSITGSRAATSYGVHVAGEIASELASQEKVLISGGAYGIDAAVHRAALAAGGHTVAVMAGGLDRPYPVGHRELLERIGDLGLLVSEQPPGVVPTRGRFIARARLVAAVSGSTTIVEAAGRSGALLVAQRAQQLGRAVAAVPGPVTSAASTGTHRLLREGVASLVADASDLLTLLDQRAVSSATRGFQRQTVASGIAQQSPSRSTVARDL